MDLELQPLNITKELIESKVSEETLMSTYYGVPIKKGLFKATHRQDNHATVGYYRSRNGRLIVKDFGSQYSGDWLYVLMNKYNCSFYQALQIAANDFGIIKRPDLKKNKIQTSEVKLPEQKTAVIQVELRDWQEYELNWWMQFGITKETLKKYHVYSCKNVFLNGEMFHLEKDNQFVFGYYGGMKDGIELWRLYFPIRRNYRFVSNWTKTKIQGVHMLPKDGGDFVVVTKSMKDCMLFHEYNIPAIAPCSENLFLTDVQYKKLQSKFKRIYLLYDRDIPGVTAAIKIKKEHPDIQVLLMPKGHKDLTDFRKACGKKKTIELVKKALEYYGEKGDPES